MNNGRTFMTMVVSFMLLLNSSLGDVVDLLPSLRGLLSGIVDTYGRDRLKPLLILNDWEELNVWTNSDFRSLSQSVTNNWKEVLSLMPEVSTNQSERLIIMAAGVVRGEDQFLARIESLADAVLSNKVNVTEFRFYKTQCAIVDHYAASSLVRRYQEPAISNLIMKLSSAGVYSQGVSRIFSGEEKELYLDAVHDGLIGP